MVFQSHIGPILQLAEFAPVQPTVITTPIEYHVDRLAALYGTMPPGEDEMWVPLAPEAQLKPANQEPAIETCCCFKVSWQTPAAKLRAHAFGSDATARTFAQADFACVGPQTSHLTGLPSLQLLPAAMVEVLPGQPITIHHYVKAVEPLTVTLDVSSTLNAGCALYRQPNLTEPLVPQRDGSACGRPF